MCSLALGLALLGIVYPLSAQQSATTGAFRGRVTGPDGQPVAGAQVVARNQATGFERGSVADANGVYAIPLLPPGGPYTVRAVSVGFQPVTREGLSVGTGAAVVVDFVMSVQAVQLAGVEVVASAQRVDTRQGGVVQRVGPEQVENLPVNGRDFTDFLNLSPLVSPHPEVGTGGQFAIAGARSSGTNIQIDGADANNMFFGENRGSSRTPFAFSLESIKEFQLITNGFDVEYGNYSGGVVNAVTKGGTNELEGSAFYFQRSEAMTAKDFEGDEPEDFDVKQFGFSLSGPLVRDRAHFFVSLDGQDKTQPIQAASAKSAGVSTAAYQQYLQILEDTYGIENPSQYFGAHQETEDNLVLFGRLDWTINPVHRLTLRQNYSNFEQANDRISRSEALTNGGPFKDKVLSTVAELNSVFGARAFNTLRLQWSYEDRPRDANGAAGYLPQITVSNVEDNNAIVFGGDGIIFRNRLEETKLQLVDNFTYSLGAHTLKVGTNNIFSNTKNLFWLFGNGSYTFSTLADFEANNPSRYTRNVRACPVALTANAAGEQVICSAPDEPYAEFDIAELSVYAQDDWQVSDRLLVTAGLRYGRTTFGDEPGQVQALEDAFGVPTGIVPDFDGISPRLSFAYTLAGGRDAVVRGGAGLLVGRAPAVLAGNVFQTDRPLLSVSCTGADIPTLDMDEMLGAGRGEMNPYSCRSGAAPTGTPEYTIFSKDFELPKTFKANLGYEREIGDRTHVGIDAIYSTTTHNFTVSDLNLKDKQFALASEMNRPVFVAEGSYNPRFAASGTRRANGSFDRVYLNESEGEAESVSLELELDHQLLESVQLSGRYAYTRAYDNGSFSCCTSSEGLTGDPVAFSPNEVGEPGDELEGMWGPSRFERRHVFVASVAYDAPWGIRVNGIWRSQSGTPWTPVVGGDVNGDGIGGDVGRDRAGNDRAMISRDLQYKNGQADLDLLDELIGENDCLAEQLGGIATRNSCRNPWWHTMDVRLSKEIRTVRSQRAELLVDLFNLPNALSSDWGKFTGVYSGNVNLLAVEGYDQTTKRVIYSVNPNFGKARPVGFDPFQFQAQVGIRYKF